MTDPVSPRTLRSRVELAIDYIYGCASSEQTNYACSAAEAAVMADEAGTHVILIEELVAVIERQAVGLRALEQEMRAMYDYLCDRAMSPGLSAEQASVQGAPGRIVKDWADRLASLRGEP